MKGDRLDELAADLRVLLRLGPVSWATGLALAARHSVGPHDGSAVLFAVAAEPGVYITRAEDGSPQLARGELP